jgi:hypothetical protein
MHVFMQTYVFAVCMRLISCDPSKRYTGACMRAVASCTCSTKVQILTQKLQRELQVLELLALLVREIYWYLANMRLRRVRACMHIHVSRIHMNTQTQHTYYMDRSVE